MVGRLETFLQPLFFKFLLLFYVRSLYLVRSWWDWLSCRVFLYFEAQVLATLLIHASWRVHWGRNKHIYQIHFLRSLFWGIIFLFEVSEIPFRALLPNQNFFAGHLIRLEFFAIG